MTLTQAQKNIIVEIDKKVKNILENNGTEDDILIGLLPQMPTIMQMIESGSTKEMEMYFDEYHGFYHYVKMLEMLAQKISDGSIKMPR